jgi:hypothetical protein
MAEAILVKCAADGCGEQVGPIMSFCHPHWNRISPEIQVELVGCYWDKRNGLPDSTEAHRHAVAAAVSQLREGYP